ncbi:uncharacterized protein LOC142541470 [Primulina tabacum]|uniref:uncharacterized protein LOC142541470 n=1 Tax=Primulina tabacum TaxID=48773 RepID=UPI003F59034E
MLAMVNIPVKFRRVAAAFDELVKAGRSCESSGSEHSADLSDMVYSYLEREIMEYGESEEVKDQEEGDGDGEEIVNDDESSETNSHDSELEDSLKNLLFDRENDDGGVKRRILEEVEAAIREFDSNGSSSPDFKRRVMALLRNRGFDAGLCKSKWEKKGRCPSGDYEYIDVNTGSSRYIVEIFIAGEFTIARPTGCYPSLLKLLPQIFVGRPDQLKQVVRLMSNAIRKSMGSAGIHVPPWRRITYMQAKWFDSYKRTQNEVASRNTAFSSEVLAGSRSTGFRPVPVQTMYYCRQDFAAKAGVRTGNLAAALN